MRQIRNPKLVVAIALVAAALCLAVASAPANAQPARVYRVGVILQGGVYAAAIDGLRDGLREAGLEEGAQYTLEVHETKEFLRWLHSKEQFVKWFEVEGGYSVGSNTFWETHPFWEKFDASLRPFRTAARSARTFGHAGPPTAKASEVYSKYIIVGMYAKAVQGMPPADVAKWAESELKSIYR